MDELAGRSRALAEEARDLMVFKFENFPQQDRRGFRWADPAQQ
jgi:hypothetical protein